MAAASIGNRRVDIVTRETITAMALQVVAIVQVAIRWDLKAEQIRVRYVQGRRMNRVGVLFGRAMVRSLLSQISIAWL